MPIGQYIFAHVNAGLTWSEAKTLAGKLGGKLASVTTAQEDAFVRKVLTNSSALSDPDGTGNFNGVWIGLSQAANSTEPGGGWKWESGEPFSFLAWATGQPDNALNGSKGLYWRTGTTIGWNDSPDNPVGTNGTGRVTNAAIEISTTAKTIKGTDGDDYIICGKISNSVSAGDGNDKLEGKAGNDTLRGGFGSDLLIGGSGRDTLTGGDGFDAFDFNNLNESKAGAKYRDVITDFKQKTDIIDLLNIDASSKLAGQQKFTFISTTAFHKNNTGELNYIKQNKTGTKFDKTIVQGDINGDQKVDFQIELKGLYKLIATDFFLEIT